MNCNGKWSFQIFEVSCSCHCSTEHIDRIIRYTISKKTNVTKLNRQNLLKSYMLWGY
jgi:hypothetical protein